MAAAEAVDDQTGPVQLASGEMGEIELTNANAMWGQSGVEWQQPFLDQLKAGFDTGMWMADYAADPEHARMEINDWVAEHTREHIPQLLPEGSIDDATRLTLTNAIWFKAPWPDELDDAGKQPFTTADGKEVDAPMVRTTGRYAYQDQDGWESVTLPYAGGDLAMTFIVPDEGGLEAFDRAFDQDLLHQATTAAKPTMVQLTFPKLDLDQRAAVGDALRELGVTAPFETDTDFEPMTTDERAQPLHLADVLHQATVTVDEHGTEAAAATAATFETVGGAITETEVTIDRPYLFVIHDLATGTPLFLGRVIDPTEG
jgi:serpin B